MKKATCIIVSLLAIIIILAGCSPTSQVIDLLKNGKYSEANSVFYEKVLGNVEAEREVLKDVEGMLTKGLEQYNAGEISADDLDILLETVQRSQVFNTEKLRTVMDEFAALKDSKDSYLEARDDIEAKDYIAAIEHFKGVTKEDVLFDQAQEELASAIDLYRESLSEEVDRCLDGNEFRKARTIVTEAISRIGDNKGFTDWLNDIDIEYTEYTIQQADKISDDGKFEDAVALIRSVGREIGENKEFNNALDRFVASYVRQTISDADKEDDFLAAMKIVKDAEKVAGNNQELSDAYNKYKSSYIDAAIAGIDSLRSEGRYAEALKYTTRCINEIGSEEKLKQKESLCTEEYIDYTIKDAQAAFDNGKDYKKAIDIISTVIGDIGEREKLVAEKKRYLEYVPILLTDLEHSQIGRGIHVDSEYGKDVNEVEYTNGYHIHPYYYDIKPDSASAEKDASVVYYINSKYTLLTGTLYRPYDTLRDESDWTSSTTVKIYGDGLLLYEGPNFTKISFDPVDFSVDITGVRELKITMMGCWLELNGVSKNYYPKVCAGNLYLQK